MATQRTADEDAFIEGFHDIPSAIELGGMSFVQLALLLSSCERGSAKYLVIENSLLRHKEAAQTNAAKFGATMGTVAALVGAVVGALLTAILSSQQPQAIVQCQCGGAGQPSVGNAIPNNSLAPMAITKPQAVARPETITKPSNVQGGQHDNGG